MVVIVVSILIMPFESKPQPPLKTSECFFLSVKLELGALDKYVVQE